MGGAKSGWLSGQAFRRALRAWLPLYALPLILGTLLRTHELNTQILLDDEWHSLNFVIGKPFLSVVFSQGLGANSIPQNIYNWILLHTLGWSEVWLRLPSVASGIAGLALFPPIISRIYSRQIAIIFAFIWAIAPTPIFYARFCRPYSMVMFFGFLGLLALCRWLKTGALIWRNVYSLSAFLAIYYHLYAAIPLLFPLVMLFAMSLAKHKWGLPVGSSKLPLPQEFIKTSVSVGVLITVLIIPPFIMNPWWVAVLGVDRVSLPTLSNYLSLLSGSGSHIVGAAFAGLTIIGLGASFRFDKTIGLVYSAVWIAILCFSVLGTQEGMHAAIQVARYSIIVFPVSILLVALAVNQIALITSPHVPLPGWNVCLATIMIGILIVSSPLWEVYRSPNNFTNHSAFHESYKPIDWARTRMLDLKPIGQMDNAKIPGYYKQPENFNSVIGIIEYPMFVGHAANLYYFYQYFHRRQVAGSFIPTLPFSQLASKDDFVYQDTPVDYILSRAAAVNPGKLRLLNTFIPIHDLAANTHRYSGWVVVVHKDLFREMFGSPDRNGSGATLSAVFAKFMHRKFGSPSFEDTQIIVWKIP